MLKSSLSAMIHRGLRTALTTWSTYASDATDANRKMRSALSSLRDGELHRAWNSWRAEAAERLLISQTVKRLAHKGLMQAFNSFCSYVIYSLSEISRLGVRAPLFAHRAYSRRSTSGMKPLSRGVSCVMRAPSLPESL